MTIKEKKYLSDIKRAIALIRTFTEETRSYTDYTNDLKTQSAVERQLAIIGEALNQYDKLPERIPLNLRDRLSVSGIGLSMLMIVWMIHWFGLSSSITYPR